MFSAGHETGGAVKLDRTKLMRAREMLGYGIETTAEVAGVSKNSVLRAEHEEDIRPVTARKIAAALEVEVRDLLPLGQASPPLDFDPGDLQTVGEVDAKVRELRPWAPWALEVDQPADLLEGGEERAEIFEGLEKLAKRRQELAPPLATITEAAGEKTRIAYLRVPTADERARLRAEYPDAVEVEDAILVY